MRKPPEINKVLMNGLGTALMHIEDALLEMHEAVKLDVSVVLKKGSRRMYNVSVSWPRLNAAEDGHATVRSPLIEEAFERLLGIMYAYKEQEEKEGIEESKESDSQ